ncbi:gp436 family protein [Okeania sp. SIO2B9]|uniref:gp436 family protein n=1 Tax=Okeania sp. SIO2B9 TaxID=2607782 RepID=UPI00142ADD1A|nr:DUF1320 domain-containing protein [Okeania sp. SIO2B9]NES91869.1 DUF1320 domain-containing protein [Okeania sp. SIO2B9]
MVQYATIADLELAFGSKVLVELTSDDPRETEPDQAKLNFVLNKASSEIDSYLGRCYQLPLSFVPDIVMFKTLDLARYYLECGCNNGDRVKELYQDAIEWLKESCCGECPNFIEGLAKKSASKSISYYSQDRVFTRQNLNGYVDSSRYYH